EPAQEMAEPRLDAVDVIGCYLERRHDPFYALASAAQREVDGRATARVRFGPYLAAVALDRAAHRREAHAVPREFRMQPEERREQAIGARHVESHAVVADIENVAAHDLALSDLDARVAAPARVLPGVPEQV